MENKNTKYLCNIDFIRFVLVMIIVYAHCIGIFPAIAQGGQEITGMLKQLSLMPMHVALCSFFMMSGYFLYNSYLKNPELETKYFVFKRVLRLWPLLLFSFVVLLIIGKFNTMCILDTFFINIGLGLVDKSSNNPACWFVAVLVVLSALFYFVIRNFGTKNGAFFCSICAFIGYAILNTAFNVNILYSQTVPYIPFLTYGMLYGISNISLGILIAMLLKELPDMNLKLPSRIIVTILEIFLFAYLGISLLTQLPKFTNLAYWEFLFIILFVLFVYNQGYFAKFLNNRFSKFLGASSYAIYIMQFPSIIFLDKYFKLSKCEYCVSPLIIGIIACFVIGVATHLLFENNINKWINRKLKHD